MEVSVGNTPVQIWVRHADRSLSLLHDGMRTLVFGSQYDAAQYLKEHGKEAGDYVLIDNHVVVS